jgi:hypothetical protein
MTCAEAQSWLVDLSYEELGSEERSGLLAHLETCGHCREERRALEALLSAADRWTAPVLPRGIAERAVARVALECTREVTKPTVALQHVLAFVLAGAAAAAVSLVLVGSAGHPEESPLKVGLAGAIWATLYGGVGLVTQFPKYRRVALGALIAVGISVVLAPVLSMPSVVEVCRRWLETAQASVVLNAALFLAGTLYASAPVFVSSAAVTGARPGSLLPDALRLAGIYTLLLGPSVYLQCHALTLSLVAPWVAGILVGSWVGSLGGVCLGPRLRSAAV